MKLALTSTVLACLLWQGVAAASDYTPLMKARKFADAERLADSRLAQDPANAEALVAKVAAILEAGDQRRFDEAAKLGEQCVAAQPRLAACHMALGNALGSKAIANGIMSAMAYAGTIRDAFKKAVELDPQNMEARLSLMTYYLQAPAIVGGGSGKARTLMVQTAAVNPEAAKLMQARLDADGDQDANAEAAVLAMPVSTNEAIANGQRDLMVALGNQYIKDKHYPEAERLLREAARRFPESEAPIYSLARLQQEQGRHREAASGFEQVLAKAPRAGAWYRLGQSQQALGEKARAAAAYEHALAFAGGLSTSMRADAQKQVESLKQK